MGLCFERKPKGSHHFLVLYFQTHAQRANRRAGKLWKRWELAQNCSRTTHHGRETSTDSPKQKAIIVNSNHPNGFPMDASLQWLATGFNLNSGQFPGLLARRLPSLYFLQHNGWCKRHATRPPVACFLNQLLVHHVVRFCSHLGPFLGFLLPQNHPRQPGSPPFDAPNNSRVR